MTLSKESLSEMSWWRQDKVLCPGRSFRDVDTTILVKYDVTACSDATPKRYGFRLFSRKFSSFLRAKSGTVPPLNTVLQNLNRTKMDEMADDTSIGYAELFALYMAVKDSPNGSRILVRVDNQGVVAGVMKGRFKSEKLNVLLGVLLDDMEAGGKLLNTVWVDTATMERLGADGLSRGRYVPEGYTIATDMQS